MLQGWSLTKKAYLKLHDHFAGHSLELTFHRPKSSPGGDF